MREAMARLAFSLAARDLSDSARACVPTIADQSAPGGALVERASRLEQRAQRLLALAVIAERDRRTPWEDIGRVLGISRQAAHQRFAEAHQQWLDSQQEPWSLDPAAEDVERAARLLDDWVLRHREPSDPDLGEHPVSGGLPRPGLAEQEILYLNELTALAELMRNPAGPPLHPEARRSLLRRRLDLLERLAALRPATPAYAEAAAHTRRHLRQLQAKRASQPEGGVPK